MTDSTIQLVSQLTNIPSPTGNTQTIMTWLHDFLPRMAINQRLIEKVVSLSLCQSRHKSSALCDRSRRYPRGYGASN